ncbi:uncharacterized protein Z520_00726 [Fonsecaea multimorphosa CBS 102226]|uniref:Uncharacterized protein n=1 Tax=Fonsecaea multimorphosa CBS 102226 TaxID=1442371 RepID=A0A0D2L4Q4_9EURO|nr:uncharacterized protein Z520_00726 [Fonsecaea multimorphosa CBS 102226]KIY04034.1 hypothetical protein Z520_00726 [Fonsecaea multimorphosa CBS 102226]OAL31870.1 hypothetical protein AYO22_00740 [Fonsecaea multimorphosa]
MDITRRRNITATIPSPLFNNLNRVEDLGCFDEEECRFFLREVGERVVPVYPFSFGMEEVYSLILERYGYAGLPDVTSVLQDLLEDERTAAGLGDDGDVWRSWRHSWRHRNDDALNPFIPKVGSFVLQHPTQPHIRKLKARNFILKAEKAQRLERARQAEEAGKRNALVEISPNQNRRTESPPSDVLTKLGDSDEENSYRLPSTTYSHQRTRTLLASGPGSSQTSEQVAAKDRGSHFTQLSAGGSSQQEFIEVDPSMTGADIDPALLVSFEMLSPSRSASEQRPTLRGGHGEIVTLQQISSAQDTKSSKESSVQADSSPPSRVPSIPTYVGSCETPGSRGISVPSSPPTAGNTEPSKDSSKVDRQEPVEPHKSAEKQRTLSDSLKQFARRPLGDNSDPSKRARAVNRQARVFDGTIWLPKVRKRQSSQVNLPADEEAVVEERKKSIVRRSLTPVWQKRDSSRNSWMDIMRNIFRSESTSSQAKQSRAESISIQIQPTQPDFIACSNNQTITSTQVPVEQERKSSPFGLDGTIDPRPLARSRSIMDYNKPLPLSPGEIVRSLSTHPMLPRAYPPQLATLDDPFTSANPKADSQAPASHRIKRKDVPVKHQLSPVREIKDTTAGHAAEPQKIEQPPLSAITYSSIANKNPFLDNLTSEIPVILPAPSEREPLFANHGEMPDQIRGFPPGVPEHSAINTRQQVPNFSLPPPQPAQPERQTSKSRIFTPIKNLMNKGRDSEDVKYGTPSPAEQKKKRKNSLQKFSDFLKHPFVSQPQTEEEKVDNWMSESAAATAPRAFVSLDPATQARILGDIELLLVTATNNFLVHEANAGHLNPEIVMRFSHDWQARGLRPVVEFLYDCRTQYNLVLANIHTVKFSANCEQSSYLRESGMEAWSAILDDVAVHAFCLPDDIVVKHLFALPQVLRMLRAPESAEAAVRGLQLKTSAKINERLALARARKAARGPFAVRLPQYGDGLFHRRDISVGSEEDCFGGFEAVVANMRAPAPLVVLRR